MDGIAELGDMLERLRARDGAFRVFGAKHHRYRLGRPLSEGELKTFETTNGCRLPEDYRRFLSEIGNGGAGPYYGLSPLDSFHRDLSRSFPLLASTVAPGDEEPHEFADHDEYPGVLEFCHQGCVVYSYLVVNGPSYGFIWDGMAGEGYSPTSLTFMTWYRRWLERALCTLDNERLVRRLRVGMTKAEVLAEVEGNWQERQAIMRPVRYFEASDIPVQLELNDRDVVILVKPWTFIYAVPN